MKRTIKISMRFLMKTACILLLIFSLFFPFFSSNDRGMYETKADNGYWNDEPADSIAIHKYDVEYTIHSNRKVDVKEEVTVEFLDNESSMFFHALPKENTRYTNITASCENNPDFYYYVADNPDMSDFLDINCVGGASRGQTWVYTICYTMEHFGKTIEDGMIIDLVGFGSGVAINDVHIIVNLPSSPLQYQVYSGDYSARDNYAQVSIERPENKTLVLKADRLDVIYQEVYGVKMAEGITLSFVLSKGTLVSEFSMQFTPDFIYIALACVLVLSGAVVAAVLLPKRREIITTVNLSAPNDMDPMSMGKLLDNVIDNEDVTSMLYYFAHKGYLHIDLSDKDDPVLLQKVYALPATESEHARTLFNGLFTHADRKKIVSDDPFEEDRVEVSIRVSELKYNFYENVATAKEQIVNEFPYEKKSIFYYLIGGAVGLLLAFFVPFIMSVTKIGGRYVNFSGASYAVAIAVVLLLGYIKENYRYKWKPSVKIAVTVVQFIAMAIFSAVYSFLVATHVMTAAEKILLSLSVFTCTMVTSGKINRTEEYIARLGNILGFKDFIVYTEQDKIKFMLEDNPQLFYKILPYAQVLGVTNEWEDKFEGLTIQPPTWCSSTQITYLDYLIIRNAMSTAMITAMKVPEKGGSFIGKGGGGGSFGGFGGGGFGGGGFGSR